MATNDNSQPRSKHFELQTLRRAKKLSLGEAAHVLGMRAVDLIRLERGESVLLPEHWSRVEEILNAYVPHRNDP